MKLLTTYKKRCLTILMTGFILLFLFILLISRGPYAGQMHWAWAWLLVIYSPPLLALLKVKPTKLTGRPYGLEILFILLVISSFIVIWSVIYYLDDESSFRQPFIWSGFLLIPLSSLLVYLVWKDMIRPIRLANENELTFLEPKVFISYNHNDSATAFKIRDFLKKKKIPVIMDQFDMTAGTSISDYIKKSLKEVTVMVSLVSNNSLKSAWVAQETIIGLFFETYTENKKVVSCYLDANFQLDDFTIETVQEINLRIEELNKLIGQHHKEGIDTRDLNDRKTRLLELRNNLDKIIGELRKNLCLDVREAEFNHSMKELVRAIKANN